MMLGYKSDEVNELNAQSVGVIVGGTSVCVAVGAVVIVGVLDGTNVAVCVVSEIGDDVAEEVVLPSRDARLPSSDSTEQEVMINIPIKMRAARFLIFINIQINCN